MNVIWWTNCLIDPETNILDKMNEILPLEWEHFVSQFLNSYIFNKKCSSCWSSEWSAWTFDFSDNLFVTPLSMNNQINLMIPFDFGVAFYRFTNVLLMSYVYCNFQCWMGISTIQKIAILFIESGTSYGFQFTIHKENNNNNNNSLHTTTISGIFASK